MFRPCCLIQNKRTNEWMNELMNELMNEWMNELMNEWINEWINELMNERINEWMNELMNEWMSEWMNEWVNEWMNEWMNIQPLAETSSSIHWRRFYLQLTRVHSALELFWRCALQITYLLTYLLTRCQRKEGVRSTQTFWGLQRLHWVNAVCLIGLQKKR